MAPRLRDLIATLNRPPVADSELHHFAARFEPVIATLPAKSETHHAQQVKRDIIASAASAMLAQATFTRQGVLALLGEVPSASPPD